MVLHALYGGVLPSLDTLGFEHLRESTLSLFGNESVFCDQNKFKLINNFSNIEKAGNDQRARQRLIFSCEISHNILLLSLIWCRFRNITYYAYYVIGYDLLLKVGS